MMSELQNNQTVIRYTKEDKDPKQEIDWSDIHQRFCHKHSRNYHYKCEACNP